MDEELKEIQGWKLQKLRLGSKERYGAKEGSQHYWTGGPSPHEDYMCIQMENDKWVVANFTLRLAMEDEKIFPKGYDSPEAAIVAWRIINAPR